MKTKSKIKLKQSFVIYIIIIFFKFQTWEDFVLGRSWPSDKRKINPDQEISTVRCFLGYCRLDLVFKKGKKRTSRRLLACSCFRLHRDRSQTLALHRIHAITNHRKGRRRWRIEDRIAAMFAKRLFQKSASQVVTHLVIWLPTLFVWRIFGSYCAAWHDSQSGSKILSDLDLEIAAHYGVPYTASVLAFDPIQRLLAIGTLWVLLWFFVLFSQFLDWGERKRDFKEKMRRISK